MTEIPDRNYCRICDSIVEPTLEFMDVGPHHAKAVCPWCSKMLYWVAKPENEEQLEKRPHGCPKPKDLGIGHCQICLRSEDQLGTRWLCTHHINGSPKNNDRTNLLVVCIACHKLIHWTRTYFEDGK